MLSANGCTLTLSLILTPASTLTRALTPNLNPNQSEPYPEP